MAYLRFHRGMRLLPGVRLNLSKSGPSLSLGVTGARVNLGPQGLRTTVGLPGTGLSMIERKSWGKLTAKPDQQPIAPRSTPASTDGLIQQRIDAEQNRAQFEAIIKRMSRADAIQQKAMFERVIEGLEDEADPADLTAIRAMYDARVKRPSGKVVALGWLLAAAAGWFILWAGSH